MANIRKLSVISIIFFAVAFVGFESSSYTVNERDGTVEVCVVVTNPPAEFPHRIITQHLTRSGTAGNKNEQPLATVHAS